MSTERRVRNEGRYKSNASAPTKVASAQRTGSSFWNNLCQRAMMWYLSGIDLVQILTDPEGEVSKNCTSPSIYNKLAKTALF